MKARARCASRSFLGAAALLGSKTGYARDSLDIEVAPRVGIATSTTIGPAAENPLGVGVGGRAGASYREFYGGLVGMYYLGSTQAVGSGSASAHTVLSGIEVGYTLPVLALRIRPLIGIGNAWITASDASLEASKSNLYLEPGLAAFVPIGYLFAGGDLNALVFPNLTAPGASKSMAAVLLSFHAQVGFRF